MRYGLPVVTSRRSSLPEVAGPAAAYVEDPLDPSRLAEAVGQVLGDRGLRERLRRAGRERARRFTWDRCAAGMAAVIRSCL
jgi:glycosyltransferase involved in cell wall biosynthesis